jgi:hypothetical protein
MMPPPFAPIVLLLMTLSVTVRTPPRNPSL